MPGLNLRRFAGKVAGYGADLGFGFANGAAINTNITITGIKPGDRVVAALDVQPPTAGSGQMIKTNLLAEIKITAKDTVQFTTTTTTGDQVWVLWVAGLKRKL